MLLPMSPSQGNEFSYFMLLASSFMLNHSVCANQWMIHPWLHSNCNHMTDADQLRSVPIPDVDPGATVAPGLLSMCAGDFAVRGAKITLGSKSGALAHVWSCG